MISLTYLWLITAIILAGADLLLGTIYLLILGASAFLGFVAALLVDSFTIQATVFALSAIVGVFVYSMRKKALSSQNLNSEKLQHINEGQFVEVHHWNDLGKTKVFYRGTHWEAVPQEGDQPRIGIWQIVGMTGNTLILKFIKAK